MSDHDTYHALKKQFDLLDETDLSVLLGVSVDTLAKHRVNGTGPTPIRAMRAVFYDASDVKAWLLKQRDGARGRASK